MEATVGSRGAIGGRDARFTSGSREAEEGEVLVSVNVLVHAEAQNSIFRR